MRFVDSVPFAHSGRVKIRARMRVGGVELATRDELDNLLGKVGVALAIPLGATTLGALARHRVVNEPVRIFRGGDGEIVFDQQGDAVHIVHFRALVTLLPVVAGEVNAI